MSGYPIYLDYNATTPVDPQVLELMLPFFSTHFGNAASKSHAHGWYAEDAVAIARESIGTLIGASPNEIIFTSGATESINLAIRGLAESQAANGGHFITVATEHKAVLDVCEHVQSKGMDVTVLPVNQAGHIDLDQLRDAIRPDTLMIAAMYANNETGLIHPIDEISRIAREAGVLFFCDANQAVGKIPVNVKSQGIDMLAFSAHKMYGPKGVGILYIGKKDKKIELAPQIFGGGHERKLRSGTLNVPGIVGMGKACDICRDLMMEESIRIAGLRNRLQDSLMHIEGVLVNGDANRRLPHVTNICFAMNGGDKLLKMISRTASVSNGSACSSVTQAPSHVLKAMGLTDMEALSSIRFSLGRFTTEEEIDMVTAALRDAINRLG
jgi:cysteine desulfurase